MATEQVPTVNDLRVKMCYICREEEQYDKPSDPPKRWVHPCNCTLVAHEVCLLDWISVSENNPSKKSANVLKCAQCGGIYEIESNNPSILKLMKRVKGLLSTTGVGVTLLAGAATIVSVGVGFYVFLVGYGEYALDRFVGREMKILLLGEDIDQWPFQAYINLPLIPLSMILGQTKHYRHVLPLSQVMMFWPSLPPNQNPRLRPADLSFSAWLWHVLGIRDVQTNQLPGVRIPAFPHLILRDLLRDVLFSWPPSPVVFAYGLEIVRKLYARLMNRLRKHILGDDNEEDGNGRGQGNRLGQGAGEQPGGLQLVLQELEIGLQIEEDIDDDEEEEQEEENPEPRANARGGNQLRIPAQVPQAQLVPVAEVIRQDEGDAGNDEQRQINGPEELRDENRVRLVLDGEIAAPAIAQPLPPPPPPPPPQPQPVQQQEVPELAQPNQAPGEQPAEQGNEPRPVQEGQNIELPNGIAGDEENEDRARINMHLRGNSLGRLGRIIGGTLMMPTIAASAGNFLLYLALGSLPHERISPRAYSNSYTPHNLLRRFLGIRPPGAAPRLTVWQSYYFPSDMSALATFQSGCALAARIILVGTPVWQQSDPVWWRNTLGLGLCFVAKDLFGIWYKYLTLRELRSRRIKDKPFEGIDPKDLDLKP